MDTVKFFEENKYVYVPNLISPDIKNFMYNYLILKSCTNYNFSDNEKKDDGYVRYCYGDLCTENLLGLLIDRVSQLIKKNLAPTYSYTRVYTRGETLIPHRDRQSCQYSVTLHFGGDPWPIFFGELNTEKNIENGYSLKKEITLNPGDAIIYMGEQLVHWRNKFNGDHHCQAFLHYIDKDGPYYPEWEFDKRPNIGYRKI